MFDDLQSFCIHDGLGVKCYNCGFKKDLYIGYGGLYDYHVFECKDCKDFYIGRFRHNSGKKYVITHPIQAFLDSTQEYNKNVPSFSIKRERCEKCGGGNISEITIDDVDSYYDIKNHILNVKCPVCNCRLIVESYYEFDD